MTLGDSPTLAYPLPLLNDTLKPLSSMKRKLHPRSLNSLEVYAHSIRMLTASGVFLSGGTSAALLHDTSTFFKMDRILVWEGVVEEVRMISIPSLVVWLEDGQV